MTTTKMKSLCLREHEVRALLRDGRVLAVRVVKPQPPVGHECSVEYPHGSPIASYRSFPDGGTARTGLCECPFGDIGDKFLVASAIPSSPSDNYIAGSDGQIYSRTKRSGIGPNKIVDWYPMKGHFNQNGYRHVSICHEGKKKTRLVHPMICEAFYGPRPFPKAQVRHLDGNPENNAPDNLCWGTQSENMRDRSAHGKCVGENHPCAKFSNFEREAIRWAVSRGICSRKYAARILGVSYSSINAICWKDEPVGVEVDIPPGRIPTMYCEFSAVQCKRVREMTRDEAMETGVERVDPYDTSPELPPGMPACWRNYLDGGWYAGDPIASFRSVMKKTHGPDAWASNPYVWLGDLRRVEG